MTEPLLCVFLDTQVFRKERFQWGSQNFQALRRRIEAGSVRVLSTDILRQELRRQAHVLHNEYLQALSKVLSLSGVAKISGNFPGEVLAYLEDQQLTSEQTSRAADRLLLLLHAEEVLIPEDGLKTIFSWYFNGDPPFGAKGKKSEFPDAANKLALINYAHQNNIIVYVVSEDEDWFKVCDKRAEFKLYQRLEQFLEYAVKAEFTSRLYWSDDEILENFKFRISTIQSMVHSELSRLSRVDFGDGVLESLTITNLDLEDMLITDIVDRDDEVRCMGELAIDVHYFAETSLDDPELANVLYKEHRGQISLLAAIRFTIDPNKPANISNIKLTLDDGLDLRMPLKY